MLPPQLLRDSVELHMSPSHVSASSEINFEGQKDQESLKIGVGWKSLEKKFFETLMNCNKFQCLPQLSGEVKLVRQE